MPVRVGTLRGQPINILCTASLVTVIPELAPMRPQSITQRALQRRRSGPGLMMTHAQGFERFARTGLGRSSCLDDGSF
jgi:hypothetical protein